MYNTRTYSGSSLDISNGNPYQREVRQREADEGLAYRLAFSAGAHTIFLLKREDLGTSLLLCPGKMFRQGDKNALSLLWHIQHLFDNLFEALNILFYLYTFLYL
jgi:hypothetical protein